METTRDRLVRLIKELPQIDRAKLDVVIAESSRHSTSLVKSLIKSGIISETEMLLLLVREMHIPAIDLTKYKVDEKLKKVLDERTARHYGVMPLSLFADTLTIAVCDPLDVLLLDDVASRTGKKIDVVVATPTQIERSIDQYYAAAATQALAQVASQISSDNFELVNEKNQESQGQEQDGQEAPVIRMVNLVIKEAIRQRASDIHMEPSETGMRVRYRIDGILQDSMTIPKESQHSAIVRIKIMTGLDITASQIPQDGRFKMRVGTSEIDFRVSLLPTSFGQKVVMRVLDKGNLSVGLSKLGFSPHSFALLQEAMVKPFGMILVTGPTGSGKSTTLYSILNQLNTIDKNIITIEDPVEYLVDGLTQIEVKHDIGLSFAVGLKAVLRQSPDVVMVGEIRDNETADIAIKASLTGQLVLSTLHTNDAAGAVTRLVDMGLEPFLVASSVICVCAQRLCRKICPYCKQQVDLPPKAYESIKEMIKPSTVFYEGKGCERCRMTGYLGRMGVTEVLVIDDQIRQLLVEGKSALVISAYAREKQGMRLLFEDAVDKMTQGLTTLAEVYRISAQEN